MPPYVMNFTKTERKQKFSSNTILSYITSVNGGNSFMAKAKEKKTKVFSLLLLTSQPIYTQWANGFRKVNARSLKP